MNRDKSTTGTSKDSGNVKLLVFFYLLTGITTLTVMVEGIFEELGWIATPAEQGLPEPIYLIVVIATFVVGFTLVVGLPAAVIIILKFGKKGKFLIPAILLLGAVLFWGSYIVSGSRIEILFWTGGTLLFLYGCSSTAAAFHWFGK